MVETDPLTEMEPGRKRFEMPDVVPLVALKNCPSERSLVPTSVSSPDAWGSARTAGASG